MTEHIRPTRNRREFVADAFCGFGALALASLEAQAAVKNPLAPKAPHMPAKAKSVIFLFNTEGILTSIFSVNEITIKSM